jgi:hypothetical protein
VILVESSSDISSESSDDGATVTYGPDGYKYIVFVSLTTSPSLDLIARTDELKKVRSNVSKIIK